MGELLEKIKTKKAKIGVIGLGYVGLPLALEFVRSGYCVTGIDKSKERVESLNKGISYVIDVKSEDIAQFIEKGLLSVTNEVSSLSTLDAMSICVPTPLTKTKDPDMSYIINVGREVKNYMRKDQLFVLESTTYPGTTEELILPMLEEGDLEVGKDFYLAFSPERIDPGNKRYSVKNIPKVIGGVTQQCTELASCLYGHIIEAIIPVSSPKVAEMVKLLENTFRNVNIALVNEIAIMSERLGIDVWEVIDAARTKPFGFMSFYPGPGLGGHCIPIDPLYLSWVAKKNGFELRFIALADQINSSMPEFVVEKITDALNDAEKSVKGSNIHILGVAYKKDVDDLRESPALEIMNILRSKGAKITYTDPYIPEIHYQKLSIKSRPLSKEVLSKVDCSVIVTDHSNLDYNFIVSNSKLIVDTRNALKGINKKHIVRL
ncbi:UDP-N-acetyl-D-glucosamine dehydrogenase [Candidatus Brocadia sapporoensis]|uniref:UDP-N-acetyl-D-glucosamine dehydrogenase n=1 Tax=Candidatus Brocadia sapporoensis TaxID=392547 RepID=A0A1V6LYU9_9BACT|nr:nucleotide sugar dehydrogenase [Candidatus Brocadia sapporoensis]MDG6004314.1 nucleotide sugar dehydrogenase [Candidatus Brocadia sp.]OQD45266.1 UDP-N-acetyl-D-glucosamine dehydrogenase [Candidatus Brocadia sapporoensis]GJQ23293.1 MAG: UDP-N-acetyl-D-glucosamine dehydrogenase [Candidatus Brocadia sapporoensis]